MPVVISFPNDTVMIQQGQKGIKIDKLLEVKIGRKSTNGEELFNILQGKLNLNKLISPYDVFKLEI